MVTIGTQSDAYAGFFLLLGFFLIARLWGASERRRHLALQDPSCAAPPPFPLGSVLAWVYLAAGGASVVGGIFLFTTDLHSGVKLMLFVLPVLLSALPFSTWSNLRQGKLMNRWRTNSAFLLTPPILLMLIVILNLGGVILASYEHDLLAYCRRWFQEPVVPLVIFLFALAPLPTALRSLRYPRCAMVSS